MNWKRNLVWTVLVVGILSGPRQLLAESRPQGKSGVAGVKRLGSRDPLQRLADQLLNSTDQVEWLAKLQQRSQELIRALRQQDVQTLKTHSLPEFDATGHARYLHNRLGTVPLQLIELQREGGSRRSCR